MSIRHAILVFVFNQPNCLFRRKIRSVQIPRSSNMKAVSDKNIYIFQRANAKVIH